MHLTEFLHPRAEEIVGMFPARLGARLEADPKWMARLDRWFDKGRRLRTDSLPAFLTPLRPGRPERLAPPHPAPRAGTGASGRAGWHARLA